MRRPPPAVPVLLAALLTFAGCSEDAEPAAGPTSGPSTSEPTSDPTSEPPTSEPTTAPPPQPTSEPPASEPPTDPPTEPTTPGATTDPPAPEPSSEPPSEQPGPPVDLDAPPTTYDEALAHFDAQGQEAQEVRRFETAAGTYCRLGGSTLVSCELPPGGIPDPDYCGDGPAQSVGRVAILRSGPRAECNSDTIREGAPTPLAVGTVGGSEASGVLCLVEDIGVTCVHPERAEGFFLGSAEYHVFSG